MEIIITLPSYLRIEGNCHNSIMSRNWHIRNLISYIHTSDTFPFNP